ncbi:VOC family protein [Aeromicrobium wangtongii]|uniref:VOC family protein n=1 Tax=Aeromicrobium wangtongii TaxID=2969247 RepID=A0ABY5M959_9ACTN|nr:VOC family protein [Aeromicrobium wangtongii]MCD9199865.1 VOC family protein [Aeromicrobium wangtongii]UUP13484.1 VOC family protein [Aeromicrobium wangtongii]
MSTLPRIRQVVLLVPDLEDALAQCRETFGFITGTRDPESMAELGFEHEVCSFADTFIELCAPLSPDSGPGRLVERKGPVGYMLVVQVDDQQAAIDRAAALGIEPLFAQDFEGNQISQWHPKSLGTLAEIDQVEPADSWHFAPRIFAASCTDVARDIVGADLATPDPAAMAQTWSQVLDLPLDGPTTLPMGDTVLRFVPAQDVTGLVAVDVEATDPDRIGDSVRIGGVDFRFVAATVTA